MGLADPELFPNPVDGNELATQLVSKVLDFVVLPTSAAIAIALWILHAHTHDAAEVSPILALTSPEKRCGKTTALILLRLLVPRPLLASNITTAALFRVIDRESLTLLIDEADSFLRDNEDLRGVLNSGHHRAGATVIRTVGENHEPRSFRTWAPKAIAHIGRLPGTLEDRAIVVALRRKKPAEKVERLRLHRSPEFEPLRQQAWRWAHDNESCLRAADPALPPALHDRAADNWRPLLAIAEQLGGQWPLLARDAALALSGAAPEGDNTPGVLLLADLRDLFSERGADRLSSAEVIKVLLEKEDRPWAEWRGGKPLSAVQLGRLLKPFGAQPRTARIGDNILRGYLLEDLQDAFDRYLVSPLEAQQPQQSSLVVSLGDGVICNSRADVAPTAPREEPLQAVPVAGVAGQDRLDGVGQQKSAQNPPSSPSVGVPAEAAQVAPKVVTHVCPSVVRWEVIRVAGVEVCTGCHAVLHGDLQASLEALRSNTGAVQATEAATGANHCGPTPNPADVPVRMGGVR